MALVVYELDSLVIRNCSTGSYCRSWGSDQDAQQVEQRHHVGLPLRWWYGRLRPAILHCNSPVYWIRVRQRVCMLRHSVQEVVVLASDVEDDGSKFERLCWRDSAPTDRCHTVAPWSHTASIQWMASLVSISDGRNWPFWILVWYTIPIFRKVSFDHHW